MPARTTIRSWFNPALQLVAAMLLCASAHAQSALLDITNTVAASDQAVPIQKTFTITDAGTYTVTLTDQGAAANPAAPLASVKFAVTSGSSLVGPQKAGAGQLQFNATTPGDYIVHVIGKPGTVIGSGPFGVKIIGGPNNAQVLAFSDTLALPPQAIPSSSDVLDDSFTVPTTGSYQVSLTDLHMPQALNLVSAIITVPGGGSSPLATLPDPTTNAYQATVNLTAGTTYRIFAVAQATSTTTGGLYSVTVGSGGTMAYSKTRPVGGVTDLGPVTLAATHYNFNLADLQYPAALSSVNVAVIQNGAALLVLNSAIPTGFDATVAGPAEVFAYAAPGSSASGGSYALTVTSGTPSVTVMSLARAVTSSTSATHAYSFDTNLTTGGGYAFNLTDFSLPAAFTSMTGLVVQNNAPLGSPLSGAGNANATETVTTAAGPISILVFTQAGTGGSLFGADLVAGSAAPAFQATQGVGQLFSSQKFTVTAAGSYAVTLTDVGFPFSLMNLAAVVTQGVTNLGSAYSGGAFGFTAAAAGDYYVTFVAQPEPASPAMPDEAGTYSIQIGPAPAAPTVTLTADNSSVASGGTVTLTWTVQNATSCTASDGWSGALAASAGPHSQASPTITAATTFTVTCYNSVQASAKSSVAVSISTSSGGGHSGGGALSDDLLALLAGAVLWKVWLGRRLRLPARTHMTLLALVTAGIAIAGTSNVAHAQANTVIAKGGSVELSATDVRSIVAGLPGDSRQALRSNLPALEKLLRGEVVQRAVLADARAKSFDHDPNTVHQLERVQQEALTRLWLANKSEVPADYPSEADVKSAYEALKTAAPLEYHLAQIFISAPDGADSTKLNAALRKATDIAGKVGSGDFAQLARTQSEHAESAAKGGDMGFLPGERLLPAVLASIKSLGAGQVVGPLKTSEGLHFVKLIETRPITLPPLQDVRQRIAADLRARRAQQLQQAYLTELSSKLGISINEIELGKLVANLN